MDSEKFRFQLFLTTLKTSLAASTFWQNSCKTLLLQKNICDGVHSHYNSNLHNEITNDTQTIHKWKLKTKTVYSDVYLTVKVFLQSSMELDSSSGCFYFMFWYCFLNDLSVWNTFLTFERSMTILKLTTVWQF